MARNHPFSTLRPSKRGFVRGLGLVLGLLVLGGCKADQRERPVAEVRDAAGPSARQEETRMWMTNMAELNGNEKHADLSQTLPTDAYRPGTIHSGDLMLYGSNTVVVFYETFRSPYAYTRLGHVDDPSELGRALGRRSSRVLFSVQ